PDCGKALLIRTGKRGPFIGCSGYPKCKYTRPGVAEAEPEV
ncbi:MAG: topoisomerase DNA-binding C4 zinc finger domain-containing protein, partial [Armatimonadota bacterium]